MISIIRSSITMLDTDAIVNAANEHLLAGGGVCGAIFSEAGARKLQEACDKIGFCKTGEAVITPGFDLPAGYVIHAVGPVWHGGDSGERQALYGAYANSLKLARENGLHSIAFPLISSGIFGYPREEAWQVALESCSDFLKENADYEMNIVFAVIGDDIYEMGQQALASLKLTD